MQNNPQKVILHCSATPDSLDSKFTAKDIDRWHKEKGWKGIGYHYYIRRTGLIEIGRGEKEIGAHTEGFNKDSLGICFEGSYFPTISQFLSLITLYRQFFMTYKITHRDWYGHNEFSNKSCPGFGMANLRNILQSVAIDKIHLILSVHDSLEQLEESKSHTSQKQFQS